MAQPAIATDLLDTTIIARAQRYERDAVAELCDKSLDTLWRVCVALAGDETTAESFAHAALQKVMDGLDGFDGDAAAFHVWLLRHAASAAARKRPGRDDTRRALARLSNFDYELVTLRVLGDIGIDHLSHSLSAQPANLRAWLVSALREVDGRSGTGWGQDLSIFDRAVEEVIAGEDPEAAGEHVSWPEDTIALLKRVAEMRAALGGPVPPEAATRLRTDVLAVAAEGRAQWVHRNHAAVATVPGIEHRRYPTRTGTLAALGIAAILAVGVGAVLAVLASFAGPESFLYPLKRFGENALITVSIDPVGRAQLETKLAETRQREAEDMAARGDGDNTAQAVSTRFDLLLAAERDLGSDSNHDARWKAARDKVLAEADTSLTAAERDLQVTGQARSLAEVQALDAQFQSERKPLEAQLGRQPQPDQTAPTPSPTPS